VHKHTKRREVGRCRSAGRATPSPFLALSPPPPGSGQADVRPFQPHLQPLLPLQPLRGLYSHHSHQASQAPLPSKRNASAQQDSVPSKAAAALASARPLARSVRLIGVARSLLLRSSAWPARVLCPGKSGGFGWEWMAAAGRGRPSRTAPPAPLPSKLITACFFALLLPILLTGEFDQLNLHVPSFIVYRRISLPNANSDRIYDQIPNAICGS
jgi:hypothetical protein